MDRMKITSGKTQINLLDFLLGFLVLVFITIVLTSMGWEAAYQSRYKKDVAPIKAELAVSQSEVNWRDEKIKQIDNFLKEHKRARKYFE